MKASSLLRLGDRIREMRIEKEWTQKQLAEASQINEVQIRRYENNQSLPREAQLIKIANALGVDKDEFYKEKIYKIRINPNINKTDNLTHALDMTRLKELTENLNKNIENAKKTQLEFIYNLLEDEKDNAIEIDNIAALLWQYDFLEDDNEKKALIYISQIFSLSNTFGKEKMLELCDIIFGNSECRKEE